MNREARGIRRNGRNKTKKNIRKTQELVYLGQEKGFRFGFSIPIMRPPVVMDVEGTLIYLDAERHDKMVSHFDKRFKDHEDRLDAIEKSLLKIENNMENKFKSFENLVLDMNKILVDKGNGPTDVESTPNVAISKGNGGDSSRGSYKR